MSAAGRFTFRRHRGSYQLQIASAEDLDRILELEEPRWAATSAPGEHFACDPGFLAYTDVDGNGRLRVRELQAAWRWTRERLRDRSRVGAKSDELRLDDIDPAHPDGKAMLGLGERLLKELAATQRTLTLGQVRAFKTSYAGRFPNGDGVLTAGQAPDPELRALIETAVATTGGSAELSGQKGAALSDLEGFEERARALVAWAVEEEARREELSPLGDETDEAVAVVDRLRPKVVQFFAQAELLGFERERAEARLRTTQEELAGLDVKDPAAIRGWLERAPLAHHHAANGQEGALPLAEGANPLWAGDLARLRAFAPRLVPGLGPEPAALTRAQWVSVVERVAPRADWKARRPAGLPGDLTPERAQALLGGPAPERLRELLAQDLRASDELKRVQDLERLALSQRWLLEVANNFVSFPALFVPGQRALFQVGRLVLDGRDLTFCTRVRDRAAHKAVAEKSGMFLVYATLTRKEGDQVRTLDIAAALTSGTRGTVETGKRGVFYDRDGLEWDAQVVDLVVNPISLLEAAVAPFVRLKTVVFDRIQKLISSKLEGMEAGATQAVDKGASAAAAPAPAPGAAAPAGGSNLQTLIIGGGAVFTGLTAALAFLLKTLSEVDVPALLKALLLLVLAVMALSAVLGWFKLRARDLATILEACEWAVNMRMFLTRRHSLLFTSVPPLPRGSRTVHLVMPGEAADRRRRRAAAFLLLLVALAALTGAYWVYRAEVRAWWIQEVRPRIRALTGQPAEPAPAGEPAAPVESGQ